MVNKDINKMVHHNNESLDNILGTVIGATCSLLGIFSGLIPDVETVAHTIVLSVIGAATGFTTSYILKKITKQK